MMKSIFKISNLMVLAAILFASAAFADNKDNQECANNMNVNIVSKTGKSNYSLQFNNGHTICPLYVTIYDSNNKKIFEEKLNSGKVVKKYNLKKFNSESYFFVIESGDKIHTEEVM